MKSELIINYNKKYKDQVLEIELNRKESYNALSLELINELYQTVSNVPKQVRIITIAGCDFPNSRGFSAGHDLKQLIDLKKDKQFEAFDKLAKALTLFRKIDQIIITKIHGAAYASGCQIACASDLAYATDNAKFSTPGINLNFFCATPMIEIFNNRLTQKKAFEMLILAKVVSAKEAVNIGLINDCFDINSINNKIDQIITNILTNDIEVIKAAKQLFYSKPDYKSAIKHMAWQIKNPASQNSIRNFFAK